MPVATVNYPGSKFFPEPVVFGGNATFQGTVAMPATAGAVQIGGANAAYSLSPVGPDGSGLKAWSFPGYLALGTGSAVTVTGSVYLSQVHLTAGVAYSTIYIKLQANGGTAAATNFAGLYSPAGALVATTADLTARLGTGTGTTGYIACPLTSAYTPPAGGAYWVAAQFNFTNAGSYPVFYTMSNFVTVTTSAGTTVSGISAPNGTTPYPYAAVATVSGTALPASFTLANAGTTGAYVFWTGLA